MPNVPFPETADLHSVSGIVHPLNLSLAWRGCVRMYRLVLDTIVRWHFRLSELHSPTRSNEGDPQKPPLTCGVQPNPSGRTLCGIVARSDLANNSAAMHMNALMSTFHTSQYAADRPLSLWSVHPGNLSPQPRLGPYTPPPTPHDTKVGFIVNYDLI